MQKLKQMLFGIAVGLAASFAVAQSSNESLSVGNTSATGQQNITLTIPKRTAMHIIGTSWTLNLNNPPLGNLSVPRGEIGCFLVPKSLTATPGVTAQQVLNQALAGQLLPINTYPAINPNATTITDNDKGGLICIFKKVIQKWCNGSLGCELDIKVGRTVGARTYGRLMFFDVPTADYGPCEGRPTPGRFVEINPPGVVFPDPRAGNPTGFNEVWCGAGNTRGWLDNYLYEAFWFDGTEVNGSYRFEVELVLANF